MPLAIDLFCGLGGWAEGFLAEGWDIVGFDIQRHHLRRASLPGSTCYSGRGHAARLAIQGCRSDRRVAAVPSLQLPGDAVEASEGTAAARQHVVRDLLPHPARGVRRSGPTCPDDRG